MSQHEDSSSCPSGSFVGMLELSLVVARGLSCSAVSCGVLVPQPGVKPMSPALQGGFLTSGPPEKSSFYLFYFIVLAAPLSMWDLNSVTGDQTRAPCSGNAES